MLIIHERCYKAHKAKELIKGKFFSNTVFKFLYKIAYNYN